MAKLVHFIHRFPPALGGAEFVAQQVCARHVQAGHSVWVETTNALAPDAFHQVFSATLPPGTEWENGARVRRHRCFRLPFQRYFLGAAQRLAPSAWKPWMNWYSPIVPSLGTGPWTADFTPDKVVVWALPHGSVWASAQRNAQSLRIPLVAIPLLHPGNPNDSNCPIRKAFRRPWIRQILADAERVIALTSWEKQELAELGVPQGLITVAGLGLPPRNGTDRNRDRFREHLNIAPHHTVVGHLATLSKDKGTLDLLKARNQVGLIDGPTLVLAGECTPIVAHHIKSLGNPPWLRVLGRLPQDQKNDFFAGIDVLCLPSLVDSWSLTLLEGWQAGKGALVYDAGGPGALVRHGQDGWKIAPGDIGELAAVLIRIQQDQGFYQGWGEGGKARIPAEFDWDQAMDRLSRAIVNTLEPEQATD